MGKVNNCLQQNQSYEALEQSSSEQQDSEVAPCICYTSIVIID